MPEIDLRRRARRRAAGDQTPAGRERAYASLPRRLTDVFDDDVGAASVGEPLDVPGEIAGVMIEHVLGAEGARALRLRRRGRGEHPRAEVPRKLNRGLPHPGAPCEPEHDVTT